MLFSCCYKTHCSDSEEYADDTVYWQARLFHNYHYVSNQQQKVIESKFFAMVRNQLKLELELLPDIIERIVCTDLDLTWPTPL
jgi:hypothetical protein